MADAAQSLLGYPTLRAAMGRRGVEHAAGFDWTASGDIMLKVYEQHTQFSTQVSCQERGGILSLDASTDECEPRMAVGDARTHRYA